MKLFALLLIVGTIIQFNPITKNQDIIQDGKRIGRIEKNLIVPDQYDVKDNKGKRIQIIKWNAIKKCWTINRGTK